MERELVERQAIDRACQPRRIESPEFRAAVTQAYRVTREHIAPFIVGNAQRMLADLRVDLARNPAAKVVFVGRDGGSFAVAIEALDPDFFQRHCETVVLSRAVVEAAIQDLEQHAGRSFPEVADFRGAKRRVQPADVPEAHQRLTEYLYRQQVPVGRPGAEVILVDSSFKGTVQELLTAAYPRATFSGKYLFLGESSADPHPDSKQGYALHWEVRDGSEGRPLSEPLRATDPTFAHQDAVAVVEDLLHGSWSSPQRIFDGEPVQQPLNSDARPLRGLNHERVLSEYREPAVREAAMDVNLKAVADYAAEIRERTAAGEDCRAELRQGEARYEALVRSWVNGRPSDPVAAGVLDSFVRRSDKLDAALLADSIVERGFSDDVGRGIWREYDQLSFGRQRSEFVARLRSPGLDHQVAALTDQIEQIDRRVPRLPVQRESAAAEAEQAGRRYADHQPRQDTRPDERGGPALRR